MRHDIKKRIHDEMDVELYEQMINDDFPVCCIHSNIPKYEREESFNQFKNG